MDTGCSTTLMTSGVVEELSNVRVVDGTEVECRGVSNVEMVV